MKKNTAIILVIFVGIMALILGGMVLFKGKGGSAKKVTPTPEAVKEVPLEERPYVSLTPRSDGREFTLEISRIKDTTTIEYELVYFSGDLSRGVIGSVDLQDEESFSRKLLLGSCSKNVCKYDENVNQGTLTLRFRGKDGVRKFASDFHLQRGDKILNSIDEKFKFEGKIPSGTYFITMSTIGFPATLGKPVVSGPYGIFSGDSGSIKNGKVAFTNSGKDSSEVIYSWIKSNWQKAEANLSGTEGEISATADSLGIFLVASEK